MLSSSQLAELRTIPSPTIANAVETFDIRPHTEGVTNTRIRCLFPEFGALVGYAATMTMMSNQPKPQRRLVHRKEYWEYVRRSPGPVVTVVQDWSEEPGGAYWGEVNSSIHRKLGALGVLTSGTVRDLDEVRRLGFHYFASGVSVSHGYAHLEDFNRQVKVFGMLVSPGDLIHADQHGAVVIPAAIEQEVIAAARRIEAAEKPMLALCAAEELDLDALDQLISTDY